MAGRLSVFARSRVAIAYCWRHRQWPALRDPRRFTEWVQWRKLNDRDAELARLTDKAHSKRLVAATLGESYVIPTLWEGTMLPIIAPWPMPFIVKANHGCGQFAVVRNANDYQRARRIAPRWLKHFYGGWLDEWHYRGARRSLLVEPFIGPRDSLPIDYKIYVFGGHAVMVQMHEGRGSRHRWSQFDREWTQLSTSSGSGPAPLSLDAMLGAAEQLGLGHDFLRVDFFEIEGRPLFTEFCLYPGSGLDCFDPPQLDDWLGAKWSAERPKRHFAACGARLGARRSATI